MEDVPSVAMYAVINAIAHSNQLVMEDANRYEMARVHWAQWSQRGSVKKAFAE